MIFLIEIWDRFGCDWVGFEEQLCWFCYTNLATVVVTL